VIGHVPYVDPECHVQFGELVLDLVLAGDVTAKPGDHVAKFAGSKPCDANGKPLSKIINGSGHVDAGQGVSWDHVFSAKPRTPNGYSEYVNYHEKVTAYVAMLSSHAQRIDDTVTARTYKVIEEHAEGSPFLYLDTATPRAGLEVVSERLRVRRIAIVGLGGTGTYILDLVAKTPVAEIHLYDGDRFLQHNAFRSPGATSVGELEGAPNKANHWASVYGRMRNGVVPHDYRVEAPQLAELAEMDFVFIAIDHGPSRELIVSSLEERGVAFVDVGLGIYEADGRLGGQARVSFSEPGHPCNRARLPLGGGDAPNEYRNNIQIAEANAINAALAVFRWKKWCGFYGDHGREHFCVYAIDVNKVMNEDAVAES